MNVNPLALGFYSVPEAARLIEVGSTRRIYGWLRGYAGRKSGPLIDRQFEPLEGREEISFLDLMELRLIEMLREQEVKARTIRRAIVEARKIFESPKPFATDRIFLKTDGREVFVEEVLKKVAQEEHDKRLWNLVTKQYEHYELIERSLLSGVTFDPESHLAKTWKPRAERFPGVVIDPRIAYGKPVTPSRAPTATLYELYKADNDSVSAAAEYFQISPDEAEMGIRFEQELIEREKIAA
jgi:uncharacterized protein (DUF433 family)